MKLIIFLVVLCAYGQSVGELKEKLDRLDFLMKSIEEEMKLKTHRLKKFEDLLNEQKEILDELKSQIEKLDKELQKTKEDFHLSDKRLQESLGVALKDTENKLANLRFWHWINIFISTLALIIAFVR